MHLSDINFIAVIVAAVSSFVLGFLWYGPFFGKSWKKLVGLSDEDIKNSNMALIFGPAFVLMLLLAITIAIFIPEEAIWMDGAKLGLVFGLGFVATTMGVNYLFARHRVGLYLIDAIYQVFVMVLMGSIIAAWPS